MTAPRQAEVFHRQALSVLDMAELAEIIEQCRIEIHRDGLQDEALFLARLAAWAAVPVWVESWHVGERRCCDVFLSEAEMHCAARRYRPPQRLGRDHVLRQAEAPTGRLDKRCVAPYTAGDLAVFDLTKAELIWTWDNGEVHPTALLCAPLLDCGTKSENLVLSIPSAWGALHSCWHGQLHLHARHVLVVCDETGQYGLWQLKSTEENPARVFGWCLQPCVWAWLGDARSSALVIEAARQIVPDARGELVGDLMDIQTGNKVNPPGVKVLLGSSHYEGTDYNGSLVINEAGQGRYPRLLGRLTRQGVLLCGQPAPDGIPDVVPWGLDALR